MTTAKLGVLISFALYCSGAPAAAEDADPFYFVDDTISNSERDREARQVLPGARTYIRGQAEDDTPEYRKQRSPLEELQYLVPGNYEAKIIGILDNSCTEAVVLELKRFKDIPSASFDFEDGVLRFAVVKLKNRPRHLLNFKSVLRAVRRAGRKARLNTHFTLSQIQRVK
ncbi:MAG: hypothetical protein ABIJ96_14690 [Elusimicrobiota bacterium]